MLGLFPVAQKAPLPLPLHGRPLRGLLPAATRFLRELLEAAFPQAEVRVYGKPWP